MKQSYSDLCLKWQEEIVQRQIYCIYCSELWSSVQTGWGRTTLVSEKKESQWAFLLLCDIHNCAFCCYVLLPFASWFTVSLRTAGKAFMPSSAAWITAPLAVEGSAHYCNIIKLLKLHLCTEWKGQSDHLCFNSLNRCAEAVNSYMQNGPCLHICIVNNNNLSVIFNCQRKHCLLSFINWAELNDLLMIGQ